MDLIFIVLNVEKKRRMSQMSEIEIIVLCIICYSAGYLMGMINKYLTKED